MAVIDSDGSGLQHLHYLLAFLAAWEDRPACLTPMAYRWCSAISKAARRLGQGGNPTTKTPPPQNKHELCPRRLEFFPFPGEEELSETEPEDPTRQGGACHRVQEDPLDDLSLHLLPITLKIGFRLFAPGRDHKALGLDHTSYRGWVFETAFSSHDDEVIADAACAWIADSDHVPAGSFARHLAERVKRGTPFSQRLRRMSIYAVERTCRSELEASGLEVVQLLDCLDVDVEDIGDKDEWARLLGGVIDSSAGSRSLSSHYWCLLDKLVSREALDADLLEELEGWMVIVWRSVLRPEVVEDIERVTLGLLLRRPSALPTFEDISQGLQAGQKLELRQICDQARTGQPPPESPAS